MSYELKTSIQPWGSIMKHRRSKEQSSHQPQLTPIAKAVRQHRRLMQISLLAASSTVAVSPALAQDAGSNELILEEITVTAQKRVQSMQDVPIAITAFNTKQLEQLGIQDFADYALLVPNLSFKTFGNPASATIYMRGAADGGDGNASWRCRWR